MSIHIPNNENTNYWDSRRNKINSSIGKWTGGEGVSIRGYSLFDDLFNKISYMQLIVLNATGKMISTNLGKWLESNFMSMSYPDSRIWCNQVGALSGTMQTTPTAATVAGCLAGDSRVYGGSQTSESAMTYIQMAFSDYESGSSIESIVNKVPLKQGRPAIIGFARPIVRDDERIAPHRKMSKELGFDEGKHMKFANALSEYLEEHYSMGINIGGYTSAFMLDQGFTPRELYVIKNMCVASGVTACYTEFSNQKENAFLPQHCDDIEYTGIAPRAIPTE